MIISKLRLSWSTFLVLAVFYVALSASSALAGPVRIMPLGDSITTGSSSSDLSGYRRPLYFSLNKLGYYVDFVGRLENGPSDFDNNHEGNGAVYAEEIADGIYGWLETNHADVVLLHIGSNDVAWTEQPVEDIANEVDDILKEIDDYEVDYDKHITVLLAFIINQHLYLGEEDTILKISDFNSALDNVAQGRISIGDDVFIVDMENEAGFVYDDTDMADFIHPNDTGYGKMADLWESVLVQDILALPSCTEGMIAYWPLDEESAGFYEDTYDDNNGECATAPDKVCPIYTTAGRVAGGQSFDGNSTGIGVPADGSFDWSNEDSFSVEYWMKQEGDVSTQVIVGRDDSTTELHWWTGVYNTGEAAFALFDTDGNDEEARGLTGGNIVDGLWHHIVIVRDARTNQNLLYVDGKLADSAFVNYSAGFDSLTAALNIGWLNKAEGYHFEGVIDEVAIYNKPLALAQIEKQYADGLLGYRYCEATFASLCPVGINSYWPLDEEGGYFFQDEYGGNDGECPPAPDKVCPIYTMAGRVAGGQSFDGNSTGIGVPADDSFDWSNEDSFSVEYWMKQEGDVSTQVIVGRDDSTTELHWWTGVYNTGEAAFALFDTDGNDEEARGLTGGNIVDGLWHHIVIVRDASTNQNLLYVDGKLADSAFVNYSTGFESLTAALNIGWLNKAEGYHFEGVIDEVAIYNEALLSSDIEEHYAYGLASEGYTGDQITFYRDQDEDGYGDALDSIEACSAPEGYVSDDTDCDDTDSGINPGKTEVPYNGKDDDCNPATPDDDLDGDTYLVANDCDDTDPDVNPGATEVICNDIDDDCNASTLDDPPDGDGDGYTICGGDCDDDDKSINPDGTEICNGVDDNCDGLIDDDDPSCTDQPTWYEDGDGDDYGNAEVSQQACIQPVGYVIDNTDCNDADNSVFPGAIELCDGIDNDCDGEVDEEVTTTYYLDSDGDNYGDPDNSTEACLPPDGYVLDNTDNCPVTHNPDQADADRDGVGDECDDCLDVDQDTICDDVDNCPGVANTDQTDTDGDSIGNACDDDADGDSYPASTDCNDDDPTVYPGAPEILEDDIDQNCDGRDYEVVPSSLNIINMNITSADPNDLQYDSPDKPKNLLYGLIQMKIEVDNDGDTAVVIVRLPGPLPGPVPDDYKWFKYSPTNGWFDYSDNVVYDDLTNEVTITLVDGGIGDDDGVANGEIIDPSGFGTAAAAPIVTPQSGGGGGGGGGCFIGTVSASSGQTAGSIVSLLILGLITGLCVVRVGKE